jgi:hypothetical protein
MYRKIDGPKHMTVNEASERYPDDFVLMQLNSRCLSDPTGVVLYVGSDADELFELQIKQNIPQGLVVDGINNQQSLGGIVIAS